MAFDYPKRKALTMYDIYSNASNDHWRFSIGKGGVRKLLVIGLNPSTATAEMADKTIAEVESVANLNGFDGFVMVNLCPVRSTDCSALPVSLDDKAFSENINRIEALVASEPNPVVWAAWGEGILARRYLVGAAKELLERLKKYGTSWQHLGSLTDTGHPRGPSRLQYTWSFAKLDADHYVQKFSA